MRKGISSPSLRAATLFALLALTLTLPACAVADSMSLSVAPAAVQGLVSQINYTADSEEGTFAVAAVNNPGVPCAANPQADNGIMISPEHSMEAGQLGAYSGAMNYTPQTTGAFTVCGWLTIPSGLLEMEGGPVTASASLGLEVRPPHVSLSLRFPRPVSAGRPFAVDLTATSEASTLVVVEGLPYTRRGCPIDYEASSAQHVIEQEITGGPWLDRANLNPLPPGRWIMCAWADPVGDGGLYPQAVASLRLNIAKHHAKRKRA